MTLLGTSLCLYSGNFFSTAFRSVRTPVLPFAEQHRITAAEEGEVTEIAELEFFEDVQKWNVVFSLQTQTSKYPIRRRHFLILSWFLLSTSLIAASTKWSLEVQILYNFGNHYVEIELYCVNKQKPDRIYLDMYPFRHWFCRMGDGVRGMYSCELELVFCSL